MERKTSKMRVLGILLGHAPSLRLRLGYFVLRSGAAVFFSLRAAPWKRRRADLCPTRFSCLIKALFSFAFILFAQIPLKAQNPNLCFIHYLLNGKESRYSELKDEKKLLMAYQNLKKYEPIQPKTPVDSLCNEIAKCKGERDTEKLRSFLAYTDIDDLIRCFEEGRFVDFIEGYSDGCCTFEDRYEFQSSLISGWSLESILIIRSLIHRSVAQKGYFDDPYGLEHAIGIILVDLDILKSFGGYYGRPKK